MTDFPLYLYEYDAAGCYSEPVPISGRPALEVAMSTIVRRAIDEKREVRITDVGDDMVFHAVNGKIVWPTREAIKNTP